MKSLLLVCFRTMSAILLCTSAALAQTAVSQPAETAAPASEKAATVQPKSQTSEKNAQPKAEEVLELTPFMVEADTDVGYLASNTLAGSRLNTPLRDTAASITVLTTEFMKDIGATNITEALAWSNNSQVQMLDDTSLGSGLNDNGTYFNYDTFRVRGVAATKTRNYFPWRLPTDNFNVGRVEESRGPNSVLFGLGSAGGVVNASTKQPLFGKNLRSATGTVSSFGTYRGTMDVNQTAFGDKFAVRLNAMYTDGAGYRLYTDFKRRAVDLSASYRVFKNTRVRAEYEIGDVNELVAANSHLYDGYTNWIAAGSPIVAGSTGVADRTRGLGQFATTTGHVTLIDNNNFFADMKGQTTSGSGATTNVILDQNVASFRINTNGPGAIRKGYYSAISAFVEQRIGKNVFLELSYNHQDNTTTAYQGNDDNPITLKVDVQQLLPTGAPNPNVGKYFIESQTRRLLYEQATNNVRLTASGDLDAGKWGKYRVAGLGESEWRKAVFNYQKEFFDGSPFNSDPVNNSNLVYRRHYVTLGDWGSYYRGFSSFQGLIKDRLEPVSGKTVSSRYMVESNGQINDNPNYQDAALLSAQARYFQDRLVIGGGYRWDWLDIGTRPVARNLTSTDPALRDWHVDYTVAPTPSSFAGRTRTYGTVFHATKNLSVFYNNSNSFSLPSATARILPHNDLPGNPVAIGQDYGFALNFLDGKYNLRANYYEVDLTKGTRFNFSGSTSSPTTVGNNILDALVAANQITAAEADAHRVQNNAATYDQHIEGYEVTFTANPTKNWRIQANYSYTDGYDSNIAPEVKAWREQMYPYFKKFNQSIVTVDGVKTIGDALTEFETNFQNAIAVEGQALPGNRKHKANIFTRYTIGSETLKGLYFGGGYRHQSKSVIGVWPNGSLQYGNSFWDAIAMTGYTFRHVPFAKKLELQLNVDNLFNKTDPIVLRLTTSKIVSGDGLNPGGVPLRVRIVEPRTWRLSATVEF